MSQLLSLLAEHADIISFIVGALGDGKLSKEEVKDAVKKAIEEAYDLKVRAEMGL
jgi:hypothetical protein